MKPAATIKEKIRHSLHLERAVRLVWRSAPGWTAANFGLILIQGIICTKIICFFNGQGSIKRFSQASARLVRLTVIVMVCEALCRSMLPPVAPLSLTLNST